MSRGRKPNSPITSNWEQIFWQCLPTYIGIINQYFESEGHELVEVGDSLQDLSFSIPKGLVSKDITNRGTYPVISQSKDYIIGYSNRKDLLVSNDLPLIIFGDHSKTIKYVNTSFIIGADGVKLLKPKKDIDERFFYYFLHGVITDTKDYGRHFKLLRSGKIVRIEDVKIQKNVVEFLDRLKESSITPTQTYFNNSIEQRIVKIQRGQQIGNNNTAEFLNQLELLTQLRQSFLREAVQGKLVKQDPKDGHAKDLLERIKAEKANSGRKEKELPPIKPEEIPFEVPENWVWSRLGEIAYIASGSTPKQDAFVADGVPYFKMYNLKNQKIDFHYKPQYIKREIHEGQLKRSRAIPGDILMNIVGPPLGKLAIIPDEFPESNFNQAAVLIRPYLKGLNSWIFWYLNEMSEINSIVTKGVAGQDNISVTQSNNIKVPLPPLFEQARIVKKITGLVKVSDDLQESIQTSRKQNELLLQQVLKEALMN